jgi:TolB-like protein/Tfp pilus assembly protein PilF
MQPAPAFRFGIFEVDARLCELRKKGNKVKLQDQPFQVLIMLLEHPGEVVTRERIRERLWPTDTFVDFDHGLNTAINRLRAALGDTAASPRFIETLPRHGYRFIASSVRSGAQPPIPSAETEKMRLAILPLNDFSTGYEQDYFSDGMTEEMITQLGGLNPRRLGVIARTSVTRYKDTNLPIDEIGRELNVQYVLEGSVRRISGRVRISAQLIQVSDQTHLWADSYERDLHDVLMLQDEVSKTIAREIQIKLTPEAEESSIRQRRVDPEAYAAYLRGRHFWGRLSVDGWIKARECFEISISRDPGFAPAYAGFADCCCKFGQFGFSEPKKIFARAREAALKAVELDPALAEAHAALANIAYMYDWDWAAADQAFRHSIALSPYIAIIHAWYAFFLIAMGRYEEARFEIDKGLELEPCGNLTNTMMGWYDHVHRDYGQAITQYQKTLDLYPDSMPARFLLASAFISVSRSEEAIESFLKLRRNWDSHCFEGYLSVAYVKSGRQHDAALLLEQLREKSRRTFIPALGFATLHFALGDMERALEYYEEAYDERDCNISLLNAFPGFDPLRSHPRFQALVKRMSFPKLAEKHQ